MRRLAKTLMLLAGFAAGGALAARYPLAALAVVAAAAGLAWLGARPRRLRFVVMGLVLVPTLGLVRGRGASGSATAATALGQTIEAGSLPNRAAATLLCAVGLWCIGRRWRRLRQINLIPWCGLFVGLAAASMAWSASPPLTLRRTVEALFILIFALGAGGVYWGGRRRGSAEAVRAICGASGLMTAAILCAFLARGEARLTDPAWRLGHEGTENQVAWVAAVGLLPAWVTRRRRDIWPRRAALRLLLAVTGAGVLLTKSRETWLGLLAGLVVAELVKSRLLRRRATGLLLALAAALALSYLPAVRALWARGSSEEDLRSASGRTQLWESAAPLLGGHLWLGHGLGAFWTPATVLALASHWSPTSLHNGYLDTVAELGVAGMAAIALAAAAAARNAWLLAARGGDRELGLALIALGACFAVINAFASVLEVFNYFPVTALWALSFLVSRKLRLTEVAVVDRGC